MDLDGFAANNVEDEIGFKSCDTFIELVDKRDCSRWAVLGNVLRDGKQVILGSRKVSEAEIIGHATVVGVWPSFVCD